MVVTYSATRYLPCFGGVVRAIHHKAEAPTVQLDVKPSFNYTRVAISNMIDFDQCRKIFASNETLQKTWGYTGPIIGIDRSPTTQITREGCIHLCGAGTNYYAWKDVSSTITTWLLPVVGTLLQAPFESNATRRTMLAITRWVGSPIASLSYVLWNIKVSAKAALMVDMAVKYDETPDRKTDFGSMRDSMYLLLVMNQYTLKPSKALAGKEAEGLLRIALFSKDLKLTDTDKSLRQMRRILARELREMRRRGAVPGSSLSHTHVHHHTDPST